MLYNQVHLDLNKNQSRQIKNIFIRIELSRNCNRIERNYFDRKKIFIKVEDIK